MIKAGIVGLGWWGQNLVSSVQGISDSIKNRQNPVIKLNKMVKALKRKIV